MDKRYKVQIWAVVVALASVAMPVCAQTPVTIDYLAKRLDRQVGEFPQEKIHVTTDRADYFGGDTLWLRAFVVDASTHRPVCASKYVYVDLKNPYDSVVSRIKIMERGGVYSGYLPLPMHIEEGPYTLTAYTLFMDNVGKDYFFQKSINVRSPHAVRSAITPQYRWNPDGSLDVEVRLTDGSDTAVPQKYNKMTYTTPDLMEYERSGGGNPVKFRMKGESLRYGYVLVAFDNYSKFLRLPERPNSEYWVSFMPEGGYLVPDVPCRIAYKAIAENGLSTAVSGEIADSKGRKVAEISTGHGGMGVTELTPVVDERYVATVVDAKGNEMTFALPGVNESVAVLRVDSDSDNLTIDVRGNVPGGAFVVVQQRGRMLAAAPVVTGVPEIVAKAGLPAGVVQVLLLDKACNTLSERLVFIRDTTGAKADLII